MVTHLLFATSPIFGENPLMGNPTVPALVQHCKEHLIMFYQQHAKASVNAFGELAKMNGQSSEGDVHKAVALADQQIAQELSSVMPMLEKAMEIAQKLAPPPQMDPQSQVALQLGQAEIQRKTQLDQATLQLKDQEQKLKQTLEQQQQAFDQQKLTAEQQLQSIDDQRLSAQQEFEHKQALADQQLKMMEEQRKEEQQAFEQRLAEMNFAFEQQRDSLQQQTEIMKNEADNRQQQITELLKNREDNETKKIIEEMKLEIKSAFDEKQSFFDRFFPKNKGQ
jgi:hypothetical protein